MRRLIRLPLYTVAVAGTNILLTDPVPEGQTWRIEQLSCENETSGSTDVRGYIAGHGYNHYLFEQDSPAAITLYWYNDDFFLAPGERLALRWTGATAGDKLRGYLTGYVEVE